MIDIITAHAGAESLERCRVSWGPMCYVADGTNGPLLAYERGWRYMNSGTILAFFHDDLLIQETGWQDRVLKEFENSKIGVVGFGGGLWHGTDDLYKTPYDYRQLARAFYRSNQVDAEVHGERFTGECNVATLDGFALIVRREILEKAGGWPVGKIWFHGYDYWLTCMAHRLGYDVRLVGVACHHLGGQTSVILNKDRAGNHEDAHRYIYREFRDVLPYRCYE